MRYIKEILQKNRILTIFFIGIGIFNAFLGNFIADYFQNVVDGLTRGDIGLRSIFFYGFLLILNYCSNYVDNYPDEKLQQRIYLDFKLMALRKISTVSYAEYQKMGTGKLVQRIENGAASGRYILFNFWFRLFRDLIPTMLFSIWFIWGISRRITCMLLAGYIVVFLVTNLLLKSLYRVKEKILNNEELLNHFLVRGFMEMLVFRMNRQFGTERRKAVWASKRIVDSKTKMTMIHEAFFTIFALLVALLDVGILLFAWKTKSISVGSVVALITLVNNAYTPIAIFNVVYVQYKLERASFARFEEILDLPDDEQLEQGRKPVQIQGKIEVSNLAFGYQEQKSILHDLSLSIHPGEKIALVGESGSGKSTLVKILMGLLKYEKGSIKLDEMELREICLNELYGQTAYLSQDSPVFDGTVRENLVFDREVSDEKLYEALERVQLLSLVKSFEEGLEHIVGERGTVLSGGEKQRLALARLLLQETKLVVLDEATSAMDNLTEEMVMTEILEALKDSTVIAIAHRLNSLSGFDRIVVFRKGKIVGLGKFEELLQENTYFRELYEKGMRR